MTTRNGSFHVHIPGWQFVQEQPAVYTTSAYALPGPDYETLYWGAYLGAPAFQLWRILVTFQREIYDGRLSGWPTIDVLVGHMGMGTRSTLLGRNGAAGRPAQRGLLQALTDERITLQFAFGKGRRTRYTFSVQEQLPLLTPYQVECLPAVIQERHKQDLRRTLGRNTLHRWERETDKTFVPHLDVEPGRIGTDARPGFVYLAVARMGYKIGLSVDPESRIHGISRDIGERVELLHTIPVDSMGAAEALLHQHYRHRRINGEWFDLRPEDVDDLLSLKSYRNGRWLRHISAVNTTQPEKREGHIFLVRDRLSGSTYVTAASDLLNALDKAAGSIGRPEINVKAVGSLWADDVDAALESLHTRYGKTASTAWPGWYDIPHEDVRDFLSTYTAFVDGEWE